MLTVNRNSLLDAVRRAKRTTDKRASLPILGCVGFELDSESGTLLVHATDLERHALYHVHAVCDGWDFPQVCVPVDRLLKILRASKADEVMLSSKAQALTLHAARATFTLTGYDGEEAPAFPVCTDGQSRVSVRAAPIRDALERVAPAMSKDETRFNLNAVCVRADGAETTLTATDGHRLITTRVPFSVPRRPQGDSLIPRLGVLDLIHALKGGSSVRVWADACGLFAQTSDALLALRWIDGEAPDYSAVIEPALNAPALLLPRADMLDAAKRVALVSDGRNAVVVVEVAEGSLTLRASNPDAGEASESIPVGYVGAPVQVAVNARYLTETLEGLAGDKVTVHVRDALSAMALLGSDDADTLAIVMPMRV